MFLPDQFSNPANPEAHRRTTGPEIERALDGVVDVLVAGVGTGGTITGVGEYLRETQPRRCASSRSSRAARRCCRAGCLGRTASRASAPGFVPPVLNRELLDEVIPVSDDDAIRTAWSCARRAGLLAGHLLRRGAVGRAAGRRAPGVRAASGSSWSCPTRASATSHRRSSRPDVLLVCALTRALARPVQRSR